MPRKIKVRLDLVYVAHPGPLILSDGSMKGMTKLGAYHYLTSDTHFVTLTFLVVFWYI